MHRQDVWFDRCSWIIESRITVVNVDVCIPVVEGAHVVITDNVIVHGEITGVSENDGFKRLVA